MRLHGHVRIQMVQRAICFLAAIPSAFVHPLDLFVTSPRSLVLLRAGNRHERVDRRKRMAALRDVSDSHGLHWVVEATHRWWSWDLRDHVWRSTAGGGRRVPIAHWVLVLTGPFWSAVANGLTWVLWHLMLRWVRGVGMVGGIGRARLGD